MTNSPSPALTIQYPANKAKFRELARMLSREDSPPDWLCRFFEDWAPCLIVDRGVHLIQPTRKEMRRRLAQVSTAADVLIGALNDTATTGFLDATGTESARYAGLAAWPAPGSEDTELGVLMELEVRHGETEVYP
jgi:hypothetical protein